MGRFTMNFNSWQFLVFFPAVTIGFFMLTMRVRSNTLLQIFLLAASLFFYACWNPAYLVLILISVLVTRASGLCMEGQSHKRKRLVLAASLIINLGILFFFKYYGFFASTIRRLFPHTLALPVFNVLLPVGISFYTFQALGYSIDVFYGRVRAERNFVTYALFVTFFPQLVAGPIERTGNLLPQFKVNHGFDYDRVTAGLKLAAWGMFKKVVIADRLAVYVNGVYGEPSAYTAAALALATFFFAFQIYCDFSGYSEIAIGAARVLGFNLMTNFRQPYFSSSISEFWRRWHISLSTWLKDYLYIPLGGNRKGALRQKLNLLMTFLLSGLWHGAAWHFVAWGALHGVFHIIERSVSPFLGAAGRRIGLAKKFRTMKAVQVCITFLLVCFAWVFFRANSIGDSFVIVKKLASLPTELAGYVRGLSKTGFNRVDGFGKVDFLISGILIMVLLAADRILKTVSGGAAWIAQKPLLVRWAGYYALVMTIVLSWNKESSQFIYFTF